MIEENQPAQERTAQASRLERLLNPVASMAYRSIYLRSTGSLSYSYLAVLPIILMYEIGIVLINHGSTLGIRISSEVLIKQLLSLIGLHNTFWFAGIILILGLAIFTYERKDNLKIIPKYFAGMIGESSLYALVLGTIVSLFVGSLLGQWSTILPLQGVAGEAPSSLWQDLVLSLGAGVYEEFIFRVILVTLLFFVLSLTKMKEKQNYVIAAVIGALIFSAIHYVGSLGDTFTLSSFTFRFVMGLGFNALFLTRGFGIAALTHVIYDIFVTVNLWSIF